VPQAVSNVDMEAAIIAALAHVQTAFKLSLTNRAAVGAGEITTTAAIDAAFA
jgi:hypothetical protein